MSALSILFYLVATFALCGVAFACGSDCGRLAGEKAGKADQAGREDEIHRDAFDQGRKVGRGEAWSEGNRMGLEKGREDGRAEGYREGKSEGFSEGALSVMSQLEAQQLRSQRLCMELNKFRSMGVECGISPDEPHDSMVNSLRQILTKVEVSYQLGHADGKRIGKSEAVFALGATLEKLIESVTDEPAKA